MSIMLMLVLMLREAHRTIAPAYAQVHRKRGKAKRSHKGTIASSHPLSRSILSRLGWQQVGQGHSMLESQSRVLCWSANSIRSHLRWVH
ncbi:hypothetical protein BKA59DRAFT_149625 [Fusarium tricinctum]|uniref:Secreted protein n=1 Tax=Fusarium tricinctum TaxID=61284 RepID=A0A8K0RXZ5_9HYPO|nr:hypothetical protein BKA59DRAFT_149625 [Fusarium tricinctum]